MLVKKKKENKQFDKKNIRKKKLKANWRLQLLVNWDGWRLTAGVHAAPSSLCRQPW